MHFCTFSSPSSVAHTFSSSFSPWMVRKIVHCLIVAVNYCFFFFALWPERLGNFAKKILISVLDFFKIFSYIETCYVVKKMASGKKSPISRIFLKLRFLALRFDCTDFFFFTLLLPKQSLTVPSSLQLGSQSSHAIIASRKGWWRTLTAQPIIAGVNSVMGCSKGFSSYFSSPHFTVHSNTWPGVPITLY